VPICISVVVLFLIILSFSIGMWFQSRDPTDLVTIQTAWGIASYVATAGGCKSSILFTPGALLDDTNFAGRSLLIKLCSPCSFVGYFE
jgi:hypothetical protein